VPQWKNSGSGDSINSKQGNYDLRYTCIGGFHFRRRMIGALQLVARKRRNSHKDAHNIAKKFIVGL
jgi:hypothetical protein